MPSPPPTHAPAYSIHLPPTPSTPTTHLSAHPIHTNLRLTSSLVPQPPNAPKTTLIRIHACGLNYRDLLNISDSPLYPTRTASGLVPCSDGAGTIVSTGPDSKWKAGDRVLISPNPSWLQGDDPRDFIFDTVLGGGHIDGTLRQYLLARDEDLVRVPPHLSLEEAATIPTAGGTAVSALFHGPNSKGGKGVRGGEWVLTQGTGGVSCFAIQLAAAAGARVVSTSSSDEKLEVARRLGAMAVVNYRECEGWGEEVRRVTGGRGVDCVVEVGGAGTIVESLGATRMGGVVHVVGS
jgi:NADPH:quinone reductase-like Zn-dependent oxidoreductase